jgi:hypothetical protein
MAGGRGVCEAVGDLRAEYQVGRGIKIRIKIMIRIGKFELWRGRDGFGGGYWGGCQGREAGS